MLKYVMSFLISVQHHIPLWWACVCEQCILRY